MGEQRSMTFATGEDEIKHWKSLAEDYERRLEEVKEELDEFQESSHALEAELEAELEQGEKQIADLRSHRVRYEQENDTLKEKIQLLSSQMSSKVDELQGDNGQLTDRCSSLARQVRDLEQHNDDLERCRRNMSQTLEDFEHQLNRALERNAFLEVELDEKDKMKEVVQRLKDESRDLRHELHLGQRLTTPSKERLEHMPPVESSHEMLHNRHSQLAPLNGAGTGSPPSTLHQFGASNSMSYGAARVFENPMPAYLTASCPPSPTSLTTAGHRIDSSEDESGQASSGCWPFCRKKKFRRRLGSTYQSIGNSRR